MRRRLWDEEEHWVDEDYQEIEGGAFQLHDPFAPNMQQEPVHEDPFGSTPHQCMNIQSFEEFLEADDLDRPRRKNK